MLAYYARGSCRVSRSWKRDLRSPNWEKKHGNIFHSEAILSTQRILRRDIFAIQTCIGDRTETQTKKYQRTPLINEVICVLFRKDVLRPNSTAGERIHYS